MNENGIRKITYSVNTVILVMVLALMGFFRILDVPFLVIFSVPTICIYLIGYILILKGRLDIYVWMVYLWLTLYMGVTTVCLGYEYGFHLYGMSMIPVMFVTEYLAFKLEKKSLRALHVSALVFLVYLGTTGYAVFSGPLYQRKSTLTGFFWLMNACIVFAFLIFYTSWMTGLVIRSEEQLTDMAHNDKLTGLYNRHYMSGILAGREQENAGSVLAIADIDFFKKINDTYGHNAGDYVLKKLADLLKENCRDSVVCRWGGEEFVITIRTGLDGAKEMMENLRKKVESEEFNFEGSNIRVTVTIGISERQEGETVDQWIHRADERLYYGKNHGRNTVAV
ncbi:MAG: GGDEF domain-containing protein [Lachnospiraceae bacterium]|nr:GGDEF domain-containing protein [Lachnospiraceae bacterium]